MAGGSVSSHSNGTRTSARQAGKNYKHKVINNKSSLPSWEEDLNETNIAGQDSSDQSSSQNNANIDIINNIDALNTFKNNSSGATNGEVIDTNNIARANTSGDENEELLETVLGNVSTSEDAENVSASLGHDENVRGRADGHLFDRPFHTLNGDDSQDLFQDGEDDHMTFEEDGGMGAVNNNMAFEEEGESEAQARVNDEAESPDDVNNTLQNAHERRGAVSDSKKVEENSQEEAGDKKEGSPDGGGGVGAVNDPINEDTPINEASATTDTANGTSASAHGGGGVGAGNDPINEDTPINEASATTDTASGTSASAHGGGGVGAGDDPINEDTPINEASATETANGTSASTHGGGAADNDENVVEDGTAVANANSDGAGVDLEDLKNTFLCTLTVVLTRTKEWREKMQESSYKAGIDGAQCSHETLTVFSLLCDACYNLDELGFDGAYAGEMMTVEEYLHPIHSTIPFLEKRITAGMKWLEDKTDLDELGLDCIFSPWSDQVKKNPKRRNRGTDSTANEPKKPKVVKELRELRDSFQCRCRGCSQLPSPREFRCIFGPLKKVNNDEVLHPVLKFSVPQDKLVKHRQTQYSLHGALHAPEQPCRFYATAESDQYFDMDLSMSYENNRKGLYVTALLRVSKLFLEMYLQPYPKIAVVDEFQYMMRQCSGASGNTKRLYILKKLMITISRLQKVIGAEEYQEDPSMKFITLSNKNKNAWTHRDGKTIVQPGQTKLTLTRCLGRQIAGECNLFLVKTAKELFTDFNVPEFCLEPSGAFNLDALACFLQEKLYSDHIDDLDNIFRNDEESDDSSEGEGEGDNNRMSETEANDAQENAATAATRISTLLAETLANHVEDWFHIV